MISEDMPTCLQERISGRSYPAGTAVGSQRLHLNQDNVKNGLGKLVLTLVQLIRDLLERQAIRRVESGSLTEEEVERLGVTFMQLSEEIERLKTEFGIQGEDLDIDLGPLGRLL